MTETEILKQINHLRKQIDKIDRKLIFLLASRMGVSDKIGKVKKKYKIPIIQKARWNDLMKDRMRYSKKLGLTLKVIDKIFRHIQKESIAIQKKAKRK